MAGFEWAGFTAPAHDCGDYTSKVFYNNTAHSGGHGALLYGGGCMEASFFNGYKLNLAAVYSNGNANKGITSYMIMVDNKAGFGGTISVSGDAETDAVVIIKNNKIFGESISDDCPRDKSFCYNGGRTGFISSTIGDSPKDFHPLDFGMMPFNNPGGSAWSGRVELHSNEFIDFKTNERKVFTYAGESPNYSQSHFWFNT